MLFQIVAQRGIGDAELGVQRTGKLLVARGRCAIPVPMCIPKRSAIRCGLLRCQKRFKDVSAGLFDHAELFGERGGGRAISAEIHPVARHPVQHVFGILQYALKFKPSSKRCTWYAVHACIGEAQSI